MLHVPALKPLYVAVLPDAAKSVASRFAAAAAGPKVHAWCFHAIITDLC